MDLGSLNMENIENILGSMSNEDMEMLKSAAESIFSSQSTTDQQNGSRKEENIKSPFGNFDFETVSSIMSIIEKMNSRQQDPRCNLLLSLKPMLSAKRQSKVDDAVKIMSLLSFLPIIDEFRGK